MELLKFWTILGAVCMLQVTQATAQGCQRVMNMIAPTSISSENYGAGQTYLPYTWCRIIVNGPTNRDARIRVTFKDFDLENSTSCAADSLTIFDLARPGSENIFLNTPACRPNPLQNLRPAFEPVCGNALPPVFTSRSNRIAIEFCADYGVEGRGWKIGLEYIDAEVIPVKPPCLRTIDLTRLDQLENMTTPNYPRNYDDLDRCTWTIRTNPKYPLRLDARTFNLGKSCDDQVVITDVTNNSTHLFCGSLPLGVLKLEDTSEVRVEFQADEWDTNSGFWIEISLVPCKVGMQACDNFDGCVKISEQCDGVLHCRDGSDEKAEYCAPECGVSHFQVQDQLRIVGGVEANRYSIPWQVAMMRQNGGQFCGGTIISDRWILTAAHCFTGGPGSAPQFKGRIGAHDISLSAEEDLATDVNFETILCHPYYRQANQHDYDYCLIKTKERIVFRKNVVPACIPRQGEDPAAGTPCLTSGWGSTQGWGSRAEEIQPVLRSTKQVKAAGDPLRHVTIPVVNRTVCAEAYGGPTSQITDRMICGGNLEAGGIDTCQGDSGGPFVCKNRYGKYMVSGIVSWGRGCAVPGFPGIYAHTGYVTNWIIDTIASN